LYLEKYGSKIHKTKYIQEPLEARHNTSQKIRDSLPDLAAKTRLLLCFRGKAKERAPDFWRVASSRLLEVHFVYKYPFRRPECVRRADSRIFFSLVYCRIFFLFFLLFFFLILDLSLDQRVILNRKRERERVIYNRLWQSMKFFLLSLYYFFFDFFLDAQLVFSHGDLTTNPLII